METREQHEKRMRAEYDAYVSAQKENEYFVLNYTNWLAGRKIGGRDSASP